MYWLLVTANIVPSSPILVTLMMEEIRSSETLVLTRVTWHNIPEDGILHSHYCENLISYMYELYSHACMLPPPPLHIQNSDYWILMFKLWISILRRVQLKELVCRLVSYFNKRQDNGYFPELGWLYIKDI
jgi:hypothetical protein